MQIRSSSRAGTCEDWDVVRIPVKALGGWVDSPGAIADGAIVRLAAPERLGRVGKNPFGWVQRRPMEGER